MVDSAIDDLVQILRTEVADAIRKGGNWKLVVNGAGCSDINYVLERHGRVRGQSPK